jgi:hypothetical protein
MFVPTAPNVKTTPWLLSQLLAANLAQPNDARKPPVMAWQIRSMCGVDVRRVYEILSENVAIECDAADAPHP